MEMTNSVSKILKYCYERRINEFSIVNFSIKAEILISGAIKLWPAILQDIQRSLR